MPGLRSARRANTANGSGSTKRTVTSVSASRMKVMTPLSGKLRGRAVQDRRGHDQRAVLGIEPARGLDLAHLLARRHLHVEGALDRRDLGWGRIAQIDPYDIARQGVGGMLRHRLHVARQIVDRRQGFGDRKVRCPREDALGQRTVMKDKGRDHVASSWSVSQFSDPEATRTGDGRIRQFCPRRTGTRTLEQP